MEIKKITPVVIYDNKCHLCAKFASAINFLAQGKIGFIGHYTELGENIRRQYLDSHATEMFWYIDDKNAYGGRSALYPLICKILSSKRNPSQQNVIKESCGAECKAPKAVFVRSASLLTHSRKIRIN